MEQKPKTDIIKTVLLIVMAALILFLLYRTATLADNIEYLQSRISNLLSDIGDVQSNVRNIYTNVDKQLKEQASLFSGVEYSLGALNTETHTVAVTLDVVPKTVTENMELSVEFGGETVVFDRDGNTFTADIPVNMFVNYGTYPLVCIVSEAEVQTEYLDTVDLSRLYQRYLPELYANIGHNFNLNHGKLYLDSHMHIASKSIPADPAVDFVKYELITEVNGTEIARDDLTAEVSEDIHDGGSYDTQFRMTIDAQAGDVVVFYLLAEDSLGYIHKIQAFHWYEEDGTVAELASMDADRIYDKNGNLLVEY
ncbi:MAG: hypothetical protein IJ325_02645 [Clostridia bacterium]|nr:hypothetical protein [Clostridia bacterium]